MRTNAWCPYETSTILYCSAEKWNLHEANNIVWVERGWEPARVNCKEPLC